MMLSLLLAAILGASESVPQTAPFHTDKSPSGTILAEHFWLEDVPRRLIGRQQIWLRSADGQGQPTRLFEHQRIADILFSPDERWIAINDAPVSDLADVRLFRRVDALKYQEADNIQPGRTCVALLDRINKRALSPVLDHTYIGTVRWSSDSRALLLVVRGHNANDVVVSDWLCVFNLETRQGSTDLSPMNRGTVYDRRKP